jgi:type IV pilus assembly protein PilQ
MKRYFALLVFLVSLSPLTRLYAQDGLVNMDIRKADILEIVQLLAASASLNIVAPDELKGEVTVRLNNVHWADALDSILRSKGFGYEKQGDVIRIDALEHLQSSLTSRVFTLKYVDATDVQTFLEGILSPQGKITSLTEKG